MLDPAFIDKHDLGHFFGLSPRAARRVCEKHGVLPYDLGSGRRPTLRWALDDVIRVRDTIRAEGKANAQPRRTFSTQTTYGKTSAQLWEELSRLQQ